MKKEQFKELIKECIQEVISESGRPAEGEREILHNHGGVIVVKNTFNGQTNYIVKSHDDKGHLVLSSKQLKHLKIVASNGGFHDWLDSL